MTDDVMTTIGAAVELGRSGERTKARDTLTHLWDQIGETGDALHRCTVAHYLADLQDDVADELDWDRRALAAVNDLDDERAQRYQPSWQVRAFMPSLHLNLADAYRRLSNPTEARRHLTESLTHLDALPHDEYGALIRTGVQKVQQALNSGSTAPPPAATNLSPATATNQRRGRRAPAHDNAVEQSARTPCRRRRTPSHRRGGDA